MDTSSSLSLVLLPKDAPKDAIPLITLYFPLFLETVIPGLSSVPAKTFPNITVDAPAAKAFVISPEVLIPPSAIKGTFLFLEIVAQSIIAESCGTPAPETILVVQIEL